MPVIKVILAWKFCEYNFSWFIMSESLGRHLNLPKLIKEWGDQCDALALFIADC